MHLYVYMEDVGLINRIFLAPFNFIKHQLCLTSRVIDKIMGSIKTTWSPALQNTNLLYLVNNLDIKTRMTLITSLSAWIIKHWSSPPILHCYCNAIHNACPDWDYHLPVQFFFFLIVKDQICGSKLKKLFRSTNFA
jgi:hypothetical protein